MKPFGKMQFEIQYSTFDIRYSFLLLLLASSLTGCSPRQRLARLVSHHAELRIADTLLIRDTIVRAAIEADTTFRLHQFTDSILIARDRLEIKLIRVHDTLRLTGKCKSDTIIRELSVPVERIKLVETKAAGGVVGRIVWVVVGAIVIVVVWKKVTA
jgi:hypothetical protein